MLEILFESAIRSLVLASAVGLGLTVFRRRNPRLELAVWTVVLVASLLMPALMRLIAVPGAVNFMTAPLSITAERAVDVMATGRSWATLATCAYGAIAAALLARWAFGLILTRALLRASAPAERASAGGVVRASKVLSVPVTFGGTIYLPADYTAWSSVKLAAVLAHERSHLERGDFYVMALANIHRAVFWFNPAAWGLTERLATLTERVSDDAAVAAVGDQAIVAEVLMGFFGKTPVPSGAMAMARGASVEDRVARILSGRAVARPVKPWALTAVIAVLAPLVVLAACDGGQKFPKGPEEISAADASTVVVPPRSNPARPNVGPEEMYPAMSKRLGEEGAVKLVMAVDSSGKVTAAKLYESSGFERLDAAAVGAAPTWSFLPGTVNGRPTPMSIPFKVTFKVAPQAPH